MNKEEKTCFNCDQYIASVGEKGYCRLYSHETALPEKACPRHKEKKNKPELKADFIEKTQKKHVNYRNVITFGAFASSTFLIVIGLIFGFNLSISVLALDTIPNFVKVLTIAVSLLILLVTGLILYYFGKKYMTARILEIIVAFIAVILFLIYSDTVFESFINYIVRYIEFIFRSIV